MFQSKSPESIKKLRGHMNLKELYDRATVYEDVLITWPIEWLVSEAVEKVYGLRRNGDVIPIDVEYTKSGMKKGLEVIGYQASAFGSSMRISDLPTEFFNHQLFDYDADDEADVYRFLSQWGLLFSPSRENEYCLKDFPLDEWDEDYKGIRQTKSLEIFLSRTELEPFDMRASVRSGNVLKMVAEDQESTFGDTVGLVVSSCEASCTLRLLQYITHSLIEITESHTYSLDELNQIVNVLEAASKHPLHIGAEELRCSINTTKCGDGLKSHGFLVSAICNQIIGTLNDPAPWRKCACKGCERIFKRKQAKSSNPDSDSIYCCDKCLERQKKRNQRAAAKARTKH